MTDKKYAPSENISPHCGLPEDCRSRCTLKWRWPSRQVRDSTIRPLVSVATSVLWLSSDIEAVDRMIGCSLESFKKFRRPFGSLKMERKKKYFRRSIKIFRLLFIADLWSLQHFVLLTPCFHEK